MPKTKSDSFIEQVQFMALIFRNRFWVSLSFTVTIFYLSSEIRKIAPFLNLVCLGLGVVCYFFIKSKFKVSHGQIVFRSLPAHPGENSSLNWMTLPKFTPTNKASTARREFVCSLCKVTFGKGSEYHFFMRSGASRPKNPTKFCEACARKIPLINNENTLKEAEQRQKVDALREEIRSYYLVNSLGPERIVKTLTPEQQHAFYLRSIKREKILDLLLKTAFGLYIMFGVVATFTKVFRGHSSSYRHSSYSRSSQGPSYSRSSSRFYRDSSITKGEASTYVSKTSGQTTTAYRKDGGYHNVVRVIDGDTVELDLIGKVRLIGVDTPETVHPRIGEERYGREASQFLKNLATGQRVRLEYDRDKEDRYGRTLGYLYLDNGTLINKEIIERGFGEAYTKYPFDKQNEFITSEQNARRKKLGLWSQGASADSKVQKVVESLSGCLKKSCGEITSCEEALQLLKTCGFAELDRDGDGVPCESLCN